MPLDAPHHCPFCEESYHRKRGLQDHITRTHLPPAAEPVAHPSTDPPPAYQNAPRSDSPAASTAEDASSVFDQESLRYALWNAYLNLRCGSFYLQHEDIRMLDMLAATAMAWKGP